MSKPLILLVLLMVGCATTGGHPAPSPCPPGYHLEPLVPGDTRTGIGGVETPEGVYRQGDKCVRD